PQNSMLVAAKHDLVDASGSLSVVGRLERSEDLLAAAAAVGRPLAHGWEVKGVAGGSLVWLWQGGGGERKLTGNLHFSRAQLQVAGLNLPVAVTDAQLVWKDGKRGARLSSVEAFGADWSGEIAQDGKLAAKEAEESAPGWSFRLHADRLNAAEFDRWTGPRARPGWLDRLLLSFSGSVPPDSQGRTSASQLIRRIRAEGEIRIDEFRLEKLTLKNVAARASLADLRLVVRDASAQYAGGMVRGILSADFSPKPHYA